ncbi:MAG: protein kinase [archaeon]|nr:protein kinase [archaeon]
MGAKCLRCFKRDEDDPDAKKDELTGSTSVEDIKINQSLFIQESKADPFELYEKVKVCGEGSFGKVLKVRSKINGILRAMKIINKAQLGLDKENEMKLIKEINILKSLDHPNIMKIYEYYSSETELFLITELCTGGELEDLRVERGTLKEDVAAYTLQQLLSVIECCHNKGIIHRDLKPGNILIESEEQSKKKYFNIKVIDFGTGEMLSKGQKSSEKIGSPYFIAPEILRGKAYDSKCDLFSTGVILYLLLCGEYPFNGDSTKELFKNIVNQKVEFKEDVWKTISDDAKDLLIHLLEKDPAKRYDSRKALDHDWIVKNIKAVNEKINVVSKENIAKVVKNIKNFSASNKLQQATLAYIVHNLLDRSKEVEIIQNIYKKWDINADGKISKEELIFGLAEGMSKEEAKTEGTRIMDLIDTDGNGYIEYEEFVRGGIDKKEIVTNENLRKVFSLFDTDGSGSISSDEIKNVLDKENSFGDKVWDEIIGQVDTNGDGEVSFEEFTAIMNILLDENMQNKINEKKEEEKKEDKKEEEKKE